MYAIETFNLSKKFKKMTVLKNISFHVNEGEVFALIGPNGVGKSTLIKILTTLLMPSHGDAIIMGHRLKEKKEVRKLIGVVSEGAVFYDQLTAMENLMFFSGLYHVPSLVAKYKAEDLLKLVDMWKWRNVKVKKFSTGMKQRINIVRAMMHSPKILFLDEPTLALDPQTSQVIRETISKARERGTTIFFTTHIMKDVEELADRIGIMVDGKIVKCGSLDKIIEDHDEGIEKIELFFATVEQTQRAYETLLMNLNACKMEVFTLQRKIRCVMESGMVEKILKTLSSSDLYVRNMKKLSSTLEEIFISITSKKSAR